MPSIPPSSVKPNYQLYCGVDNAAKTFTAATCKSDEEPTKASNFKQVLGIMPGCKSIYFPVEKLPTKSWYGNYGSDQHILD